MNVEKEISDLVNELPRGSGGGGHSEARVMTIGVGGSAGGHSEAKRDVYFEVMTVGGGGGKEDVPDHIAKAAEAIKTSGKKYADTIRAAGESDFEAAGKRRDEAKKLADRIEKDAEEESLHMLEWALRSYRADGDMKALLARLNGKSVDG